MSYLFNTPQDTAEMLSAIGAASIEQIFADQIPDRLRLKGPLALPSAMNEMELTQHMQALAVRNMSADSSVCYLGGGAYDHFIPAAVDALASRGEFFTSYTPYQPEVSQGNLQVTFEYETLICELSGMDVSNASLYDGGTSAVEAALMCLATTPSRKTVLVSKTMHPQYRSALATYLQWLDAKLVEVDFQDGRTNLDDWKAHCTDDLACAFVSLPNYFGGLENVDMLSAAAKACGASVVAVFDPIGVGLLKSPADYGADIAVAEGQCLGNPLQFGGPYLGILACRESFIRRMPGRIAGQTQDRLGNRCWVLTLQTREQHIRREKATSNICTNQGLFALRATIYLSLLGPQGLKETAEYCLHAAQYLKDRIAADCERFEVAFDQPTWREFVVRDKAGDVPGVLAQMQSQNILGGIPLGGDYSQLNDCFSVAVTEKRTQTQLDQYVSLLQAIEANTREATYA
jgi:glycine dehydrogenase subunit 1